MAPFTAPFEMNKATNDNVVVLLHHNNEVMAYKHDQSYYVFLVLHKTSIL